MVIRLGLGEIRTKDGVPRKVQSSCTLHYPVGGQYENCLLLSTNNEISYVTP